LGEGGASASEPLIHPGMGVRLHLLGQGHREVEKAVGRGRQQVRFGGCHL
jgi:hypothetical protein